MAPKGYDSDIFPNIIPIIKDIVQGNFLFKKARKYFC